MVMATAWCMPNKWTFKMKPVAEILDVLIDLQGANWADPFCGHSLRAQYRNDMDPKNAFATHHMDALDFVKILPNDLAGVLFDPPYSPRQMADAYKLISKKVGMSGSQNARLYSKCKDVLAKKIKIGGTAISFGWNSTGFGKNRGFKRESILIINHGAAVNDTIMVIEKRIK